jgi:hypothetical protein
MANKSLDLDPSRFVHPVALDDPYQNSACHCPLASVGFPIDLRLFAKVLCLRPTLLALAPSSLGLNRLDPGNQAAILSVLTRNIHSVGLALKSQTEQRLGSFYRRQFQLLVTHLS